MTAPPLPRTREAVARQSGSRLALLPAFGLLPWSVQLTSGGTYLVFAWGLVSPATLTVVPLSTYLLEYTLGVPGWLLAWPLSTLYWLLAIASAGLGAVLNRRDRRVTAGLLFLAGLAQLWLAWAFSVQPGRVALPLGTALLWGLAWLRHRVHL